MQVQAINGGKIHETHAYVGPAWPWCRGKSPGPTSSAYRYTDADSDCKRCLPQRRRRAAAEATPETENSGIDLDGVRVDLDDWDNRDEVHDALLNEAVRDRGISAAQAAALSWPLTTGDQYDEETGEIDRNNGWNKPGPKLIPFTFEGRQYYARFTQQGQGITAEFLRRESPVPAEPALNVTDDLKVRTGRALLLLLALNCSPRRAVRRVAWDTLCEARGLEWTPAQQAQVVDFVAATGAELFLEAGRALRPDTAGLRPPASPTRGGAATVQRLS